MTEPSPDEVRDASVQALAARVAKLTDTMREVKPKAEQAVPRYAFKTFVLAAVLTVLVALVVEHAMITRCFLTPSQTGWQAPTCSALFPGYAAARRQQEANLASFRALIADVPTNKARIGRLERKAAQLEGEVKRLKGRR
jgi:hypothetical protein